MHKSQLSMVLSHLPFSKFVPSLRQGAVAHHYITLGENFLQASLKVDFENTSRNECQIELFHNVGYLATC